MEWNKTMNEIQKRYARIAAFAACATVVFATSAFAAAEPGECKGEARMDARARREGRPEGIFGDYWWANRFLAKHGEIAALKGKTVDLVMLGDSITHFWEERNLKGWLEFASGRTALNLGYSGDRTQQVIWRIEHGELDGYSAKVVAIMIGTNNNSRDKTNPEDVAAAVKKIVGLVREKQPQAKIILHAIFPRGNSAESKHAPKRARNDATNAILKAFAQETGIVWLDLTDKLTDSTGWVPKDVMRDELHPTAKGYEIWRAALEPLLAE